MEKKLSSKVIMAASQAKTYEELLALVKAEGLDYSEEMVRSHFAQINKTGELADEELDNVVGGGCGSNTPPYVCEDWDPVVEGDPYIDGQSNCPRCNHCGINIYKRQMAAILNDESPLGAPTVPNSVNYCSADDDY